MTKKCKKCKLSKPQDNFNFKYKAEGIRSKYCKNCSRLTTQAAYYKKRSYYLERQTERNQKEIIKKKIFLYRYLNTHPCMDCGIQDPVVLQFDHVRGSKRHAVSVMVQRRYSLKAVIDEIKKCEVRCANCHARKTATERNYWNY